MLLLFVLISFDNVKRTIIYNNAKTDKIIVNNSEEPKYLVIYPPGSIL